MANIYVAASATWNGKALKKAKKDVSAFDLQIKNFAKTFGAAFSARALMRFSKSAVNAFAADEKAAKALNANKGAALVVAGSNDVNVQIIVNAINEAVGAGGKLS